MAQATSLTPAILVVTAGSLAGTRLRLGSGPILIGRAEDSTLVLDDDYASTRHARIVQQGRGYAVEDLGSTNGTYLDRARDHGAHPGTRRRTDPDRSHRARAAPMTGRPGPAVHRQIRWPRR